MTAVVPRPVAVSFLLALGGVLFVVGMLIGRLAGPVAVGGYVLALIGGLAAAGVTARRRTARRSAGRTCTCCTSTVHDPVEVI